MKSKYILVVAIFLSILSCSSRYVENSESKEMVILVHGLIGQPYTMLKIERGLSKQGYSVYNFKYPSVKNDIDSITSLLHKNVSKLRNYKKIHFVTHSLGGLVLRAYLDKYPSDQYGKLVMIAPPNRGALLAERFDDFKIYKLILGETGQKLGKGKDDYWNSFPAPDIDFGIISGGMDNQQGVNPMIPGDDDGIVGVQETQINGAQDTILIRGLHNSILWQTETVEQVVHFLKQGKFNHNK